MPTPGQVLVIAGGAALAYLALRRRPVAADEGDFGCNPSPYNFDRSQVVARIDNYLDQGKRDPGGIAQAVASDLFSPHPTGPAVVFPPVINPQAGLPLPGVQCVFDLVGQTVLERMDERGIEPGPDPQEDEPIIFQNGAASDPGYPWSVPTVHHANYPTPGMFFIVGQPTMVGNKEVGISSGSALVRAALGSAMAMAQNFRPEWVTAPPANAGQDHPYFNPNAKRLRQQMARLIRYSPWNDQLYGQTDPNKAGGSPEVTYMMEPCGRGLNWLPYHADNIARLGQGKQPLRTTTLTGNKLPNGGAHHMQLWIPAVNLDMLRGNVPDASLTVTTNGMQWPTGDATLVPPPVVWQRGIENPIAGAASWGCPGVS